jgi:hypothetical protein
LVSGVCLIKRKHTFNFHSLARMTVVKAPGPAECCRRGVCCAVHTCAFPPSSTRVMTVRTLPLIALLCAQSSRESLLWTMHYIDNNNNSILSNRPSFAPRRRLVRSRPWPTTAMAGGGRTPRGSSCPSHTSPSVRAPRALPLLDWELLSHTQFVCTVLSVVCLCATMALRVVVGLDSA